MPETLSADAAERARLKRAAETPAIQTQSDLWKYYAMRPINDLLILNRNTLFRLMSALAFFSGIVGSADMALFIYYVEENLGFNAKDIAMLFLVRGLTGIFVMAVLLKPLNSLIGERRVIMFAFFIGAVHNYLYGIATTKRTFFIASTIATLCSMSFPTISAIKANNVVSL
jgi:Na+/melibiose symporter-like transporter